MKHRNFAYIVIISFIISSVCAYCFANDYIKNIKQKINSNIIEKIYKNQLSYKSIKPIKINKYDLLNKDYSYSALIKIKELETDIKKYLKDERHTKKDKELVYNLYLDNLRYYANFLDFVNPYDSGVNYDYSSNYYTQTFKVNDIEYVFTHFGNDTFIKYKYPEYYCNSIVILHADETEVPQINPWFQRDLSLYLNSNWQKYWDNRVQELVELKGSADIFSDGSYTLNMNKIAYFIKLWSNFQKINTNKDLAEDIENRLDRYIYAFLYPNIYDFEHWGQYEDPEDCTLFSYKCIRQLTNEGETEFIELFINLDEDTKAYKILSNSYQILKKNNYKTSEEYYKSFVKNLK